MRRGNISPPQAPENLLISSLAVFAGSVFFHLLLEDIAQGLTGIIGGAGAEFLGFAGFFFFLKLLDGQAQAAFLGGNGDMAFFNKLISLIRNRVVEYWLKEQKKDPDQFDYYFSFLASGFIGIIREWFQRDMKETPAQMAAMAEHLVLYGMGR